MRVARATRRHYGWGTRARGAGGEGPAAQCIGPVGVMVSKDTRIRPKDDYPHSHGEGIVIRSRAFVNNPSQRRLLRRASSAA